MSEYINGTALPIHGWEMSGPEIPWICPKYKHTEKHRGMQRSPTCSDLSPRHFWCCVLFKKGHPEQRSVGSRYGAASQAIVLQQTRNRFLSPIRVLCSTVHFPMAVPSAPGVIGQAVPGCHCAALCQKQQSQHAGPNAARTGTQTHD